MSDPVGVIQLITHILYYLTFIYVFLFVRSFISLYVLVCETFYFYFFYWISSRTRSWIINPLKMKFVRSNDTTFALVSWKHHISWHIHFKNQMSHYMRFHLKCIISKTNGPFWTSLKDNNKFSNPVPVVQSIFLKNIIYYLCNMENKTWNYALHVISGKYKIYQNLCRSSCPVRLKMFA